ncbi:MAG: hypothetical protein E7135_06365 [Rikenellaceae bacterium]|nr:hypothetical protein [Rikenellaceae bacterium]
MSMQNEDIKRAEQLVERYPWWGGAHLALVRAKGFEHVSEASRLVALIHPLAAVARREIDVERLTYKSSDDMIDLFLHHGGHRIVAEEGDAEDLSTQNFSDDDDMVSEELAEIYLNQGLYEEAIETYRKLSLVNSKKSVYFAGLIEEISGKMNK